MAIDEKSLFTGLVCESDLPLTWRPLDESEYQSRLSRTMDRNQRLLQTILTLGEQHTEGKFDDGEVQADLVRIETKLDILLELVSDLLSEQRSIPGVVPICLDTLGIRWRSAGKLPGKGERIAISVYLDPKLPMAVDLGAEVINLEAETGNRLITAIWLEPSPMVSELLEKYIFRQHRLQIASLRAGQSRLE